MKVGRVAEGEEGRQPVSCMTKGLLEGDNDDAPLLFLWGVVRG
jgi:hypothetical protein